MAKYDNVTVKTDDAGRVTIGTISAKHAYDVEVNRDGQYVKVYANNRNQAGAMAEAKGYTVRSVNMIG